MQRFSLIGYVCVRVYELNKMLNYESIKHIMHVFLNLLKEFLYVAVKREEKMRMRAFLVRFLSRCNLCINADRIFFGTVRVL